MRKVTIGTLVAILSLTSAAPAFGLVGNQVEVKTENSNVLNRVQQVVESTTNTTKEVTNTVIDTTDKVAAQNEKVEQRKAELRTRLEEKAASRTERLEGRRLAKCQNRQTAIKNLMTKSVENSQIHLGNIQRFEQSIRTFAGKKAIDSNEAYVAMLSDVEAKEAAAIAALDVLDSREFDCASADGAKPAAVIRDSREEKRAALRAYRDSVIQLIQVTKQAFASTQTEEGTE